MKVFSSQDAMSDTYVLVLNCYMQLGPVVAKFQRMIVKNFKLVLDQCRHNLDINLSESYYRLRNLKLRFQSKVV